MREGVGEGRMRESGRENEREIVCVCKRERGGEGGCERVQEKVRKGG